MTFELLLGLPTRPDRRTTSVPRTTTTDLRPAGDRTFDVLLHAGRAAEVSGFDGVVLPFDPTGEDPLVVTAALAAATRSLRIISAVLPSASTPVYAAKVAASLQRLSGDRLGWTVDVDGPGAGPGYGDALSGVERIRRDEEFLRVARGVASTSPFDHSGHHYSVVGGGLDSPLGDRPFPLVSVIGSSDAAVDLAATQGDRLIVRHGAREALLEVLARLRRRAAAEGRQVDVLVEVDVIARETGAEALRAARDARVVGPGTGGLDGRALVGGYEDVARELRALDADGVAGVVVHLRPTLEEAYRFGHFVRPRLDLREATHVA